MNWHHVAVTRNGSTVNFYIDGKNAGSTTMSGSFPSSSIPLHVGYDGSSFKGFIDDPRLYDYALNADQIKVVYNQGASAVLGQDTSDSLNQGLAGYWKMDDGVGNACPAGVNKACDSSGNGNTGTWTNGTASTSGKFGYATNYDGVNDYVALGSVAIDKNVTISSWIKTTDNGQKPTVSNRDGSGLVYYGIKNNKLFVYDNLATPAPGILSNTSINTGTWRHVVWTSNGSTSSLYIDGALDSTYSHARTASTGIGNIGWDDANDISGCEFYKCSQPLVGYEDI
jgi:Concanavalin A-like lectin/glucanases superfamily